MNLNKKKDKEYLYISANNLHVRLNILTCVGGQVLRCSQSNNEISDHNDR